MKRNSTIFLQGVTILIGIATLVFMLCEPLVEGRNLHATFYEIYFKDLFLAYAYIASISFFVVLYKVFKLFGYIRQNKIYSINSIKALKIIKYCAISLVCFILVPEIYLFVVRPGDDIAGGVAVGFFLIFVSVIIAVSADVFEGLIQSIIDMKSKLNK
nr:DUF2975 domain-containing protein [Candidatus Gracilibacteria bacterium]